jgi:hypothetical protein
MSAVWTTTDLSRLSLQDTEDGSVTNAQAQEATVLLAVLAQQPCTNDHRDKFCQELKRPRHQWCPSCRAGELVGQLRKTRRTDA